MRTLKETIRKMSLLTMLIIFLSPAMAQNGSSFTTISGKLKDAKTNEDLFFAYVTVPDSHIGTVTNSEGYFTLKINNNLNPTEIEFSHLGYKDKRVPISNLMGNNVEVALEPSSISIDGITVRPADPRKLVSDAFKKVNENYSKQANMLTGFYRETIKQRWRYISISEAVLDIYKAPYTAFTRSDRVKIFKGRKSTNVKKADTLAVKLQGGPRVSLLLDVVKNNELLFFENNFDYYEFTLEDMVTIDEKINYVIKFEQKSHIRTPLYYGKLYIDTENLAITNAQFSLNLENEDEAANLFVLRKPRGVKFTPTSTSYYVNYVEHDGVYYLNYVRNELSFKANWKRRIFNSNYSVTAELAITDRSFKDVDRFPYRESFKERDILSDAVESFNDEDFWGEHNYIRPEESIERAIERYGKRLMRD
ncbi:MAG: carboxypeptidase-like regulatory domain-containing protein [Perlabentimonas sp.]